MRQVGTVSLQSTENIVHEDVQLWSNDTSAFTTASASSSGSYAELKGPIECLRIPLALVVATSFTVYTENTNTETYLESVMGWEAVLDGVLGRGFLNGNTLLIFRVTGGETLTCIVLDLERGPPLPSLPAVDVWYTQAEVASISNDNNDNSYSNNSNIAKQKKTIAPVAHSSSSFIPSTSKFDKVLQKRKLSINPFLMSNTVSTDANTSSGNATKTVLSSTEQVEQTINKLILSGLRIRGLSINPSHSVNDKLTIKEIYHTTYKSALFALRKYNYSFNTTASVQLHQVQDIVEKLLQTYVDVDVETTPID